MNDTNRFVLKSRIKYSTGQAFLGLVFSILFLIHRYFIKPDDITIGVILYYLIGCPLIFFIIFYIRYPKYLKKQEAYKQKLDSFFGPKEFKCFKCDTLIRPEDERCSSCGWTWKL